MTSDGRYPIRVHTKGCQNIGREIQRGHGSSWDIQANSVEEAVKIQEQEFINQDMGAYDYDIEPCTKRG